MSDIKNQIRNNNTSLTQSQINFKNQSAKRALRTTNNTNNFIETHYSISLREKYLKQGPLTNNQKKFLNYIQKNRVINRSSDFN
jgi:hypothetical protein